MNLLDAIRGLFADRSPLLPADKPAWAAAQTLGDLGGLTARWLRGEIRSTPGYYGEVDVDEDDAPGLTDTLVALNHAGFVTENSQAGCDDTARYENAPWGAWVTGFADDPTYRWLRSTLAGSRFRMYAYPPRKGRPVLDVPAGGLISRRMTVRDLTGIYGDALSDAALAEMVDAWQVVIYDPRTGSNDLWPVLRAAAETRTGVTS